jgi:hypothetical protein
MMSDEYLGIHHSSFIIHHLFLGNISPSFLLRIKYKHGNIEFSEARQNCIK